MKPNCFIPYYYRGSLIVEGATQLPEKNGTTVQDSGLDLRGTKGLPFVVAREPCRQPSMLIFGFGEEFLLISSKLEAPSIAPTGWMLIKEMPQQTRPLRSVRIHAPSFLVQIVASIFFSIIPIYPDIPPL